jgi:hypothetical protein
MNRTTAIEQEIARLRELAVEVRCALELRGVNIRPRVETEEIMLEWWHTHPEQTREGRL